MSKHFDEANTQLAVNIPSDISALRTSTSTCTRCPLSATRSQVVFGFGPPNARLLVLGEAPGAEEDRAGRPFLGVAGATLTSSLKAAGIARSDSYIANVVMCRPPKNRRPRAAEVSACAPHLNEQIRLVGPRVILALGAAPTKRLLGPSATVAASRGTAHRIGERLVVATYHPSPLSLNRKPERRTQFEADLLRVARLLDG